MPPRPWHERVEDIIAAIERIQTYTASLGFDAFMRDQRTIDAVIRNLEVIGEASGHVPPAVQQRHPSVPWREMRAMRNLLSHAYFVVDVEVVWKTIRDNLPSVVPALRSIVDDHGPSTD